MPREIVTIECTEARKEGKPMPDASKPPSTASN
jgi:hypothetical protein